VTFGEKTTPFFPPPLQRRLQGPPAKRNFLAVVGDLEFFVDVGSVECDGAVADAELSSDFLFKVTGSHEFEGEVSSLFDSIEAKQILQVADDFLILGIVC
jgi:hypothetical protein